MTANVTQDQASKLAINKQILEIKKKIQLSEGQRKALFEETEAERKTNADKILKLKKDIAQLVISLNESRSAALKNRIQLKRLEAIIGPADKKISSEAKELLDLQIIDKSKQLNLLRYRIKQKQKYLSELGTEYQTLISERAKKQITERIDNPIKKATCDLTNSIHAVELQLREAEHVKIRYTDIKKSLQDDAAKFEGRIREIEEQLRAQNNDIERLRQINAEASRMRALARGVLLQEERAALSVSAVRDKQASDGKRLVERRRDELEKLERRIFQGGRGGPAKQEVDEPAAEDVMAPPDSPEEVPLHPVEIMSHSFGILKQATGATETEEVLTRFHSQKETLARLMMLRKNNEDEKKRLERHREKLAVEFEKLKYAEVQDTEQNIQEMEHVQELIHTQRETACSCRDHVQKTQEDIKRLTEALHVLHISVNPFAMMENNNPSLLLQNVFNDLKKIVDQTHLEKEPLNLENVENETKWLPNPYNALLNKSPLPQTGASPAPQTQPGSEDEEEVPSRGFLKRQAQLVVDAKLRRKNIRMLPRRK